MTLRQLDWYILSRTIRPVSAAVGIALIALLLERLVRLLDLTLNKGGPLTIVLKLLANLVPHYLGIALPAAFFLGILLAFYRLNQDCEMDALQSAGVNPMRLLAPVLGLGIVLTLVAFVVLGYLQPYTRYAYRALLYTLNNSSLNASLDRGTFFTGFDGRTILVDDISNAGKSLAGIFVYRQDQNGGSTVTTAHNGQVYREPGELRLILQMQDGVWIETDPGKEGSVLSFKQIDLPLDLLTDEGGYRERGLPELKDTTPGVQTKPDGSASRELTIPELWMAIAEKNPQIYHPRFTAELHARLVRVASILLLPFLAASLGLGSRRNPRNFRILAGVVILILYHHIIQFGQDLVAGPQISPWLALWLPLASFGLIGVGAFLWATGMAANLFTKKPRPWPMATS